MKMHFYIDDDIEAERCKQSIQGHTPTTVSGFDTMTGRINRYSGLVLAVDPVGSFGNHWRITIDAGYIPDKSPPIPESERAPTQGTTLVRNEDTPNYSRLRSLCREVDGVSF